MDKNKKKDLICAYILEIPIVFIFLFYTVPPLMGMLLILFLILNPLLHYYFKSKQPFIKVPSFEDYSATMASLMLLGFWLIVSVGYWAGLSECKNSVMCEHCCEEKCLDNSISSDLYRKAKIHYQMKDYNKTIEYLEMANKIENSFEQPINDVREISRLDKEIKNNPKDYRLYIKRADLKNVFEYSMFAGSGESITSDYYGAIMDYTKALKLNPNAYEVYEKRGDAWAEYGYQACVGCKRERTKQNDENAINDYESAIKYTGGSDKLFAKLGSKYMNSDPQKALHYFNMVKNLYSEKNEDNVMPYPDGYFNSFNFYSYSYVPTSKVVCYSKLKDYESALEVVDEIIENETDENIIKQAKNMKFYYNWKAKHYIKAVKSADDCSVWVCKILGLVF
ncbi:hypothetical protein IJ596_03685 [bacterium]|nr:hypothetical protein [bacterium]